MTDHNGVLTMQRLLLAGALGMTMARKAAAILEGEPGSRAPGCPPQPAEGAVLRAILDAANECLGHFDDRPPSERWCDALLQLLDLAAFAGDLGAAALRTLGPSSRPDAASRLTQLAERQPPDRPARRDRSARMLPGSCGPPCAPAPARWRRSP